MVNVMLPPRLEDLPYDTQLNAGLGVSTIIADIDFETYSEAGFTWNTITHKFDPPHGASTKGLPTIGTAVYSEHPTTEILSIAYDLKDGKGKRLWRPTDQHYPWDLFNHIKNDGLIESWNMPFERWLWDNVCLFIYVPGGWPLLPASQLRCAMAKARAFALPGSLDAAGNVMNITNKKDKDGKRLLTKFSMPRVPTKKDPRFRILPQEDPQDADLLYKYNLTDIAAEAELSSLIPDLSLTELEIWRVDQTINRRGVQVDREMVIKCMSVVEQAHAKYNAELCQLTGGKVEAASELPKMRAWLMECGVSAPDLTETTVTELLTLSLHPQVRRILEIRQMIGAASVKKLYAMLNQMTRSGRVHDLFIYHAARTGRWAGTGPQPQNLTNGGPLVASCLHCTKHYGINAVGKLCPWCCALLADRVEWNPRAVTDALETIASGNLECVEFYWGDAIELISGCLRGMFISAPGKDLICSDYSAIEAVVLAMLAGEQWRIDVFNTHGKIYETSAGKITGMTLEDYVQYKKETGSHHPDRKLGKVAELASGYGGWIGAWKNFGADKFMSDEQIKQAILAWRKASPEIVEFWGGQMKDWYPKFYGLEGAAVQAVLRPGTKFSHRSISYLMQGDVLYCELLSSRYITYHRPRLVPSDRRQDTLSLSYEGWNTNPLQGAIGWVRMQTYGGKLTENVVQAVARDILAHALVNLERAGYPVVLHVHDEIVSEIPENYGSIDEFEEIMSRMPSWAAGWPIKANGGWRAKRYAK